MSFETDLAERHGWRARSCGARSPLDLLLRHAELVHEIRDRELRIALAGASFGLHERDCPVR